MTSRQSPSLRPEAERLLEELERPETTHYRRAEIGDRLDRIGDPRPGVGLRPDGVPDIVWCEIPPGTVQLEGVDGEFEVERFFIAKYPVTYRQYQAFLDDPQGYANRSAGGRACSARRSPASNIGRPATARPRTSRGTTRWPTAAGCQRALCGYEVTLADASGSGSRPPPAAIPTCEYPWGPDWVEGRANTYEGRLSRTTAVGMYPDGATAQGVLDLAGNVWEWCLNKYEDPNECIVRGRCRARGARRLVGQRP